MQTLNKLLLAMLALTIALAGAGGAFSQSAPDQAPAPKPAPPRALDEVTQLKVDVLQLKLENASLRLQLLQVFERDVTLDLNALLLAHCVAIGGKAMSDCDVDFSNKPFVVSRRPPPPAKPEPAN